jgi:hypothetical protein
VNLEKLDFRGEISGYSSLVVFNSEGRQIYSKTFPAHSIMQRQRFRLPLTADMLVWKKNEFPYGHARKYGFHGQVVIHAYDTQNRPIFKTIRLVFKY